MIITKCEKHGEGEITQNLLNVGWTCVKCKEELIAESRKPKTRVIRKSKRALTTDQFIERAKKVHGDTYDYSLVDYINSKTKVKILCREHGIFKQSPTNHTSNGDGCPTCGDLKTSKLRSGTTDQFIEKAREVHGDIYDYSLVDYVNNFTKIKIICNQHGIFEQRPTNHISQYNGCPTCGGIKQGQSRSITTKQFIEKAKEVHGDIYDYSLVKYVNAHTKVKIICKEHGTFEQQSASHTNGGRGCPGCGESLYLDKPTILYYAKVEHNGRIGYKIGITTYSVKQRYAPDIKAGTVITTLKEWNYPNGKEAYEAEQKIIAEHKEYIHSEASAIIFHGARELFNRDVLELDND